MDKHKTRIQIQIVHLCQKLRTMSIMISVSAQTMTWNGSWEKQKKNINTELRI